MVPDVGKGHKGPNTATDQREGDHSASLRPAIVAAFLRPDKRSETGCYLATFFVADIVTDNIVSYFPPFRAAVTRPDGGQSITIHGEQLPVAAASCNVTTSMQWDAGIDARLDSGGNQ